MKETQQTHTPDTIEEYLNTQHKEHRKQPFVEAFRHLGMIAPACKKAGISRSTFYRWFLEDSDFFSAVFEAFNALYKEKGYLLEQIPRHKRHQLFDVRESIED